MKNVRSPDKYALKMLIYYRNVLISKKFLCIDRTKWHKIFKKILNKIIKPSFNTEQSFV